MLGILDISATGLQVQRNRLTAISNNIANAQTTRATLDQDGNPLPYRRRTTLLRPRAGFFGDQLKGVKGAHVVDPRPFKEVYRPGHPDANPKTGYLKLPNVDPLVEQVDAINAQRAYEANVAVMSVTKTMMNNSLGILA